MNAFGYTWVEKVTFGHLDASDGPGPSVKCLFLNSIRARVPLARVKRARKMKYICKPSICPKVIDEHPIDC